MRVAELFCGAGGMSAGLKAAGLELLVAYDKWKPALDVYRCNIGPHARLANLGKSRTVVDSLIRLRPDLIAGGPPCQEFSSAGPRVEGARAALVKSFATIIVDVRPTWFLLENVRQIRTAQAYRKARRLLKKFGYGLTEEVLDASLCGVPQKRLRFFAVGRLGAPDGFLSEALTKGLSTRPTTMRDMIGGTVEKNSVYFHRRYPGRRSIYSLDEPAPTVRGTLRDPRSDYVRHEHDRGSVSEARALTISELAAIQTFPPEWVWKGSKTDVVEMIGNAVPPKLAAHVGRAIIEYERAQLGGAQCMGCPHLDVPAARQTSLPFRT